MIREGRLSCIMGLKVQLIFEHRFYLGYDGSYRYMETFCIPKNEYLHDVTLYTTYDGVFRFNDNFSLCSLSFDDVIDAPEVKLLTYSLLRDDNKLLIFEPTFITYKGKQQISITITCSFTPDTCIASIELSDYIDISDNLYLIAKATYYDYDSGEDKSTTLYRNKVSDELNYDIEFHFSFNEFSSEPYFELNKNEGNIKIYYIYQII